MSPKLFSLAMNEISDHYIEEALTYQVPAKRHRARALLRMALAACLAIIMALGTAMAVSAEFREVVVGWIKEQYETFTHYEYRDEEGNNDSDIEVSTVFVPHRLTEIPPGYTEIDSICDEEFGQQLMIYRNEKEGKSCFVSAGSGGNAYVEAEGYTIQPVEVAGVAGELYIPDDPTKDSCIVWMKENMFFYISGYFTPEEMVYYAECFQPVPEMEDVQDDSETARPEAYQLGFIPEGYTFLTENHSPHDHTILYANEAGHTLSFCYIWDPGGAEMFVKHKDHTQMTATVHGVEADLLLSNDLLNESSCISWVEDDILFHIAAYLPEDEMIALAESVTIRPKEYRLGYIPEGYAYYGNSDTPSHNADIYVNEEGHGLSFYCITEPEGSAMTIIHKDHTHATATVHGVEADLQISNIPDEDSSSITWEEDGVLFYLAAFLPKDELIALAESVEEVPLSEMEEET